MFRKVTSFGSIEKRLGLLEPFSTLAIDNNFAERAMRPIAIGRKNWLFVGSDPNVADRQLQKQLRRSLGLPEGRSN